MPDLIYPTSMELEEIARDKLPRLTRDRPIFDIFPMRDEDNYLVSWEQRDNLAGLAQVRGLNGDPPRVKKTGAKRFQMEPGVYGEHIPVDEVEMTTRRAYGTFGTPVDVSDLVMEAQDHLLGRLLDRAESILWSLTANGTFSVPGPSGAIVHTDSYTMQQYTAVTPWANFSAAAPLSNFRDVQLLARGHGVTFGADSIAYMNRITANRAFNNLNPQDLYGRRTQGLGTINSPAQLNALLVGDDLPQILVYDEGYLIEPATPGGVAPFVPFLPDGVVIVVGKRLGGQSIGAMKMTRNANNPGMAPGMYNKIIDHAERRVPRLIEVHAGMNAGPVLWYPSAIVRMNV